MCVTACVVTFLAPLPTRLRYLLRPIATPSSWHNASRTVGTSQQTRRTLKVDCVLPQKVHSTRQLVLDKKSTFQSEILRQRHLKPPHNIAELAYLLLNFEVLGNSDRLRRKRYLLLAFLPQLRNKARVNAVLPLNFDGLRASVKLSNYAGQKHLYDSSLCVLSIHPTFFYGKIGIPKNSCPKEIAHIHV